MHTHTHVHIQTHTHSLTHTASELSSTASSGRLRSVLLVVCVCNLFILKTSDTPFVPGTGSLILLAPNPLTSAPIALHLLRICAPRRPSRLALFRKVCGLLWFRHPKLVINIAHRLLSCHALCTPYTLRPRLVRTHSRGAFVVSLEARRRKGFSYN